MTHIKEIETQEIKTKETDMALYMTPKQRDSCRQSWLSCTLQLDQFDIKDECFAVSGYMNIFWRWPLKDEIKPKVSGLMSKYFFDENENDNLERFVLRNSNDHYNDIIIKVKDLTDPTVKFNNKLPIDCRRLFDQQSEIKIKFKEPPSLYYNTMTGATHLCMHIKTAKFSENLELFAFPFDFQFLNIKLAYKYKKYGLLKPDADGQTYNEDMISIFQQLPRGHLMYNVWKVALKVTINELLQHEIEMKSPWIYFDSVHQCIRLRIINKEGYHVWTLLFPLLLVVSCSFCAFFINDNDEKLSYTMTVLLTYAATQYATGQHLPKISEMLFCDYYILIGYIVQGLIIIWSVLNYVDIELVYYGLDLFFLVCVILWLIINSMYLILWIKLRCCLVKDRTCTCNRASNHCSCCGYIYELNANWNTRANDELVQWNKNKKCAHYLKLSEGSQIHLE